MREKPASKKNNVIQFPLYRKANEEFLRKPPSGVGPDPVEYKTTSNPLTPSELESLKADMKRANAFADKLLKLPTDKPDPKEPTND